MGLFTRKKKSESEIQQEKLEKEKELNDELNSLNEKYGHYIDKLHLASNDIMIFKGFKIKDGEIHIYLITPDTLDGFQNHTEYFWFQIKYSKNPEQTRVDYLMFEKKLNQLGYEIKKMG